MKNVHVLIKVLVQLKNIESPDYNPDTFYKLQSALKKSLIKNDLG
jgi:replication-associated recombination protein RarA